MKIFIRTLDNENIAIKCEPNETIRQIKEKIEKTPFIKENYKRQKQGQTPKDIIENPLIDYKYHPADELILFFSMKSLIDTKTLSDYNIQNESTLHVIFRMRGGCLHIDFVDVEKGLYENLKCSKSAPKWRKVIKGLNLFGICKNSECQAFNKEVIYNVGITHKKFNLQKNILNIKCPICNGYVVPKTCGFLKCEYQFVWDKIEDGKLKHVVTKCKETKDNNFEY